MLSLIIRRFLYALPIAIGVSIVCFSLVHLAPGDPLNAVVGGDAPASVVVALKRAYGFDKPLPVQYAKWLFRAATGDLGRSIATGRPVSEELRNAIGNSVVLAVVAAAIGFSFGCLFGGIAGYARGSAIDKMTSFVALLGVSVPHYWLGMVMVILFSVELGALPAIGIGPDGAAIWAWGRADWAHAILPAITLAVIPLGIVTRTVRAAVAEALNQEFVQALRAKGLRSRAVLRHVMKNVAPVCLAVMGIQFGYMLGGSILVETVFAWPGTGFLMNDAIFRRDIPVLQGVILVLAMFFVVLNLAVDVLQTVIDPESGAADAMILPGSDIGPAPIATVLRDRGYWGRVLHQLARDPVTIACAMILIAILLSAVFANVLAPVDPYKTSMLNRLKPIGYHGYLLGSDELGRDMLSRLLYGGRLSLLMGIGPVLAALIVGGLLGVVAGFVGGAVNTLIMRTVDVFYAFPSVLLAIAISGSLGAGITNAVLSLTVVFIPPVARVAESVTTGVRNLDYVEAARASGAGAWSIMRTHVLRNVLGPIFVYATTLISVSIILASGLSFLGLGVEPPHPEWGLMLNTLRPAIYIDPAVAAMPGIAILVTSICFNLLTDGLRQAMDVRS